MNMKMQLNNFSHFHDSIRESNGECNRRLRNKKNEFFFLKKNLNSNFFQETALLATFSISIKIQPFTF